MAALTDITVPSLDTETYVSLVHAIVETSDEVPHALFGNGTTPGESLTKLPTSMIVTGILAFQPNANQPGQQARPVNPLDFVANSYATLNSINPRALAAQVLLPLSWPTDMWAPFDGRSVTEISDLIWNDLPRDGRDLPGDAIPANGTSETAARDSVFADSVGEMDDLAF